MADSFLAGARSTGVVILNFHDARGLAFDHLFIGGLNDSNCPARHHPHPLLKDEHKLALRRATGRKLFRTAPEKSLEEPLLFYLALQTARESVCLSYCYATDRGGYNIRSPFLDEVNTHLILDEVRIQAQPDPPKPEFCLEKEELFASLIHGQSTTEVSSLVSELARIQVAISIENERDIFFRTTDRHLRSERSGAHTGTLNDPTVLTHLKERLSSPPGNTLTPTGLETFGACPFRFFLQRLVGISAQGKPTKEVEASEEGILAHEILHEFYRTCKEMNLLPLKGRPEEKSILTASGENIFSRWQAAQPKASLFWETTRNNLMEVLTRVIEIEAREQSPFIPELFEHPFEGIEIPVPPDAPVFLRGTIDRVDVDHEHQALRVVDYKLGSDSNRYTRHLQQETMGVTSFQMPIYLLAAAKACKEADISFYSSLIARYLLLKKGEHKEKDLASGEYADFLEEAFLCRLSSTAATIRSGDYQITPTDDCHTCDYDAVCRFTGVTAAEE
jgi:ATP-dependent helicase/DNAse subunit B